MMIDMQTHVWGNLDQLGREVAERLRTRQFERWGQLDASPAAHERAMACVDGAVVLGYRSQRLEALIPNELIAQFVAQDPHRRVGVAGVDPMCEDAMDQLETAIGLGLVGVTISPAGQGFHPAHSAAMRIYERCAELGMPVFMLALNPLTTSGALEFARPALWDEVARAFPSLRLVISQLGHPWIDETLLLLEMHEHAYAEISGVASRPWQLYNALLNASSFGVMEKLMFGSGFPLDTPAKAIEALYSINAYSHGTQLPSIPRSSLRAIVERDSLACLGVEAEIRARADVQQQAAAEEIPVAAANSLAGSAEQTGASE